MRTRSFRARASGYAVSAVFLRADSPAAAGKFSGSLRGCCSCLQISRTFSSFPGAFRPVNVPDGDPAAPDGGAQVQYTLRVLGYGVLGFGQADYP
jgi:hypothetical protein